MRTDPNLDFGVRVPSSGRVIGPDDALSATEVAELLGVSSRMVLGSGLPRLRVLSRNVRFAWRDVAPVVNGAPLPKATRVAPEAGTRITNLYAIRNPLTGLIKIGLAAHVRRRLRGLSCANGVELELLASRRVGEGESRELESALHTRLAAHRTVGEWFRPVPEVLAVVEEIAHA